MPHTLKKITAEAADQLALRKVTDVSKDNSPDSADGATAATNATAVDASNIDDVTVMNSDIDGQEASSSGELHGLTANDTENPTSKEIPTMEWTMMAPIAL